MYLTCVIKMATTCIQILKRLTRRLMLVPCITTESFIISVYCLRAYTMHCVKYCYSEQCYENKSCNAIHFNTRCIISVIGSLIKQLYIGKRKEDLAEKNDFVALLQRKNLKTNFLEVAISEKFFDIIYI